MLRDSVKKALSSFKRTPEIYIYFSLLTALFYLLSLFAAIGILIMIFFSMSLFNYSFVSLAGFIIMVLVALFAMYLLSGFHGASIKAYSDVLGGRNYNLKTGYIEFVEYGTKKNGEFFLITLIRCIVTLIPLTALYFLYTFLQSYGVPYIEIVLGIIGLGIVFLIHFFFFPTFISLAVYETGVVQAFRNAGKMIYHSHVKALLLFFFHAFVGLLNLIPIVQIFSFLLLHPLSYTSLIALFKRSVR